MTLQELIPLIPDGPLTIPGSLLKQILSDTPEFSSGNRWSLSNDGRLIWTMEVKDPTKAMAEFVIERLKQEGKLVEVEEVN